MQHVTRTPDHANHEKKYSLGALTRLDTVAILLAFLGTNCTPQNKFTPSNLTVEKYIMYQHMPRSKQIDSYKPTSSSEDKEKPNDSLSTNRKRKDIKHYLHLADDASEQRAVPEDFLTENTDTNQSFTPAHNPDFDEYEIATVDSLIAEGETSYEESQCYSTDTDIDTTIQEFLEVIKVGNEEFGIDLE